MNKQTKPIDTINTLFIKDGSKDSDLTKPTLETRVKKLETLLLPFKNFSSNQLYEMYDEYCRRQLTGTTGNYYAGQISRTTGNGIGTQTITGLGFKPKMIRAVAYLDGFAKSGCWGVAVDGVGQFNSTFTYLSGGGGGWDWNSDGTFLINLPDADFNSVGVASISSYDADGFTISWDTVQTTFYVQWEAFG